jgi:hypothetical protein
MMVMMQPTSLWILFNDLMAKTKTLVNQQDNTLVNQDDNTLVNQQDNPLVNQ